MAAAVAAVSDVKEGVESDGKRSVEFTLDFDTGDYTANGIPLGPVGTAGRVLNLIGLKTVNKAYIAASASVDKPYTQTQFNTSQGTVTAAAFVDIGTNGTPENPLLRIYVAASEHGASAVAATRQFRLKLIGT